MENENTASGQDLARQAAEAANAQPERVDPDFEPLGHDDVAAAVAAMTANRKDLLAAIEAGGPEGLDRRAAEDAWSVRQVLLHIADTELYYLTRLGLAERLPEQPADADPLPVLDDTRRRVLNELNAVDDEWMNRTVVVDGETWTLRKVLRRLQEHEAEHLAQVQAILGQ